MDRDMGGGRGMRGMYDDGSGRGYDDGRGRGYDAMVVAEAMGRLGRGQLLYRPVCLSVCLSNSGESS